MGRVRPANPTLGVGAPKATAKGARRGAMASTAAPATQRDAALLPTLKLTRKKGLSIDPVGRNAWVVRGALDARECDAIREAADACGYSHATSRGPKFGEAHRDHGRAGYHDETLSERVWRDTGLGELLTASLPAVREGAPVGLNPALRVYRYATHEVFGSHYDDYANTDAGVTAFTFLLYLTGDEKKPVVGGETAFFPSCSDGARALFEVKPERGAALIFKHGAECMPHASLPVREGVKVVLRSDIVCRKA
jgi:hypothetical protein